MDVRKLMDIIGSDFYTGVPDSQLRPLCDCLQNTWGSDPKHHIIAANEGNAAALAAGYHLATGKIPVVYMQNSGEGNIINPAASLLNRKVYALPVVFIVGWRGEPGTKDEPQHIYQGAVTLKLLEDMDIAAFVIGPDTGEDAAEAAMADFRTRLARGQDVAFVIRKGALQYTDSVHYSGSGHITREAAVARIAAAAGEDPIISTTGKASRELFEIRAGNGQSHRRDFLTVGSMGHCSSIALGVALNKPQQRIWCVDGDGAVLMHMGAMAVIGSIKPKNLIHVVINNSAHETVGGMPTVGSQIDLCQIARACGYQKTLSVTEPEALDAALEAAGKAGVLTLVEIHCTLGSRKDLGRPTTTALENRDSFMEYLRQLP